MAAILQQSTPAPSATNLKPLADAQSNNVADILQQHEKQIKSTIPSMLLPEVNKAPSPSKLFADYQNTGNPLFKEAAGHALNFLTAAAQDAHHLFGTQLEYNKAEQSEGEEKLPTDKYAPILTAAEKKYGLPIGLMMPQLKNENADASTTITHQNNDKHHTIDLGLMQINSANVPWITKAFAKMGRTFNWKNPEDSIEAAAMVHQADKKTLGNLKVEPTAKNLFDAYNVGPQGVANSLNGNKVATTAIAQYNKGTMFQ